MSAMLVREFNGRKIDQRSGDGYMDATAMCKANKKLFAHYWANKTTQEYVKELSDTIGIPMESLLESRTGRQGGTYVHPRVATHLAQWCSPKFAVAVSKWVLEILTTGKADIRTDVDPLIAQMEMLIEMRKSQLEQERKVAAVEVKMEAIESKVDRAMKTADAAQQQADSNFGWFSVLGWCKRIGRHITVQESAAVGRKLTAIMKRSGRQPHQTSDPRFGLVNLYPEPLLMDYFRDGEEELFAPCLN